MSSWLRIVWIALGLFSFATVAALFLLPADWSVERTIIVEAPPEAIFPLIDNLQRWTEWSPWQADDYEGLAFEYSGPPAGEGAEQRWDSEITGDGMLRIVESVPPRRVVFEMRFQGGKITALDTIALSPVEGGATRVVWTDHGTIGSTLLGRLSVPVVEESMGRDLENGLARLKARAEAAL